MKKPKKNKETKLVIRVSPTYIYGSNEREGRPGYVVSKAETAWPIGYVLHVKEEDIWYACISDSNKQDNPKTVKRGDIQNHSPYRRDYECDNYSEALLLLMVMFTGKQDPKFDIISSYDCVERFLQRSRANG